MVKEAIKVVGIENHQWERENEEVNYNINTNGAYFYEAGTGDLYLLIPGDGLFQIGTGSGYQCAVLAQVFEQVFSVERIKSLQWQAKRRLHQLDLYNVSMKHGDGWQGWQTKGPFSGIIVTAAAKSLPQALLEQLEDDGALLVPIGEEEQVLTLVVRKGEQFIEHKMAPVRFVPLIAGEISL